MRCVNMKTLKQFVFDGEDFVASWKNNFKPCPIK